MAGQGGAGHCLEGYSKVEMREALLGSAKRELVAQSKERQGRAKRCKAGKVRIAQDRVRKAKTDRARQGKMGWVAQGEGIEG